MAPARSALSRRNIGPVPGWRKRNSSVTSRARSPPAASLAAMWRGWTGWSSSSFPTPPSLMPHCAAARWTCWARRRSTCSRRSRRPQHRHRRGLAARILRRAALQLAAPALQQSQSTFFAAHDGHRELAALEHPAQVRPDYWPVNIAVSLLSERKRWPPLRGGALSTADRRNH